MTRNQLLTGSLILNTVFVSAGVLMLGGHHRPEADGSESVTTQASSSNAPLSTSPPVQMAESPFRWSQLESSDYRVYIANLRNIGCPEQTIRDIVRADLADLYEVKRSELSKEHGIGTGSNPALTSELQRLDREQARTLAQVLGVGNGGGQAARADGPRQAAIGDSETSERNDAASAETTSVSMPIVFSQVDHSALGLNPDQSAAIARIQNDFTQRIGGTSADPATADYLSRWKKAQPDSDDLTRAMLGQDAFLALQFHTPLKASRQ